MITHEIIGDDMQAIILTLNKATPSARKRAR